MNDDFVYDIIHRAVKLTLMLSAPMLLSAILVGILISIFQAVTQINEQTLSFVPKILVIVGALVLFAPWMIESMTTFTSDIFISIPKIVGGR